MKQKQNKNHSLFDFGLLFFIPFLFVFRTFVDPIHHFYSVTEAKKKSEKKNLIIIIILILLTNLCTQKLFILELMMVIMMQNSSSSSSSWLVYEKLMAKTQPSNGPIDHCCHFDYYDLDKMRIVCGGKKVEFLSF